LEALSVLDRRRLRHDHGRIRALSNGPELKPAKAPFGGLFIGSGAVAILGRHNWFLFLLSRSLTSAH
jgi:hypothetical protein